MKSLKAQSLFVLGTNPCLGGMDQKKHKHNNYNLIQQYTQNLAPSQYTIITQTLDTCMNQKRTC